MSSGDRKPYLISTVLDQEFLDNCQDNMTNQLEMVVEIESPTGTIYASDRNKYVGEHFYEALLVFPTIKRTIGEWLSPTLEFSTITLELSNVDGRFNNLLPGGADFDGWIQRQVVVKLGLRDVASTYRTIFRGRITEVGGFSRTVKSIKIIARDEFEKLNVTFPTNSFTLAEFSDIEDNLIGKIKPIIYGDWTTNIDTSIGASIPALPVNGFSATVQAGNANLDLYISENANVSFDTSSVIIFRSGVPYPVDVGDVVNVAANNNRFELRQSGTGGTTLVDGATYAYRPGDKIFVKMQGKELGAGSYNDNIVEMARDILTTYAGLTGGDFDANWNTFRDKNTPSQSAIANFKARIYRDKGEKAITFALSLLEQVRLEAFITKDQTLKINSLHFEDLNPTPTALIENWDVAKGTFNPNIDVRNNFNRCQGLFNFIPDLKDNYETTSFLRNDAAITQAQGKVITKGVVFPNLYETATVTYQVQEILKLASSYFEIFDVTLTWRSLLLEPGDFVSTNVQIGSTILDNVPSMVRNIGYDPKGIRLPCRLWSFQMTPYPGYVPGYANTVGGYNATLTQE